MSPYFDFMRSNGVLLARCFFALTIVVDALFLYAAIFNPNLPSRIADRFFGALSGQKVRSSQAGESVLWWQWCLFVVVSSAPIIAWALFEVYFVRHR